MRGTFNAQGNVVVRFKTTNETNIAGFSLYRQNAKREWIRRNSVFKQAQHSGTAMNDTYRFTDKQVQTGKTYRYKIEVVYLDGHSEWTEIIRVK